MRTPVPSEPRTFSLKDDTCFSGIRIHASDREVVGGGYLDLNAPIGPSASSGRLIPAHGFVYAPVEGSRPGEVVVPCEANFTVAERAAMREMVGRVEGRAAERLREQSGSCEELPRPGRRVGKADPDQRHGS